MESIGRYQIVGELGRGAMGLVYRAVDPNIGRAIALKTMRLDGDQIEHGEMLLRFRNEARAAGLMNHPNIVTVYDADECGGIFYIAMEYLEGETLQSLMAGNKVLPVEQISEIAKQVASGLDYAHAMKVVHRDIKPANIMITPQNALKIMDFGISKSLGAMTRTGHVLGTPYYMSPEQVMGRALDGRSDLFSFGVVLYEMATGVRPFAGEDLPAIIYKIINENPIPPCEQQIAVHPSLSAVISRCLAKNPNDRYQTGAQLAADLENSRHLNPASEQATTVMAASRVHGQQRYAGRNASPNLATMPVKSMTTQAVHMPGTVAVTGQAGAHSGGVVRRVAPAKRSITRNITLAVAAILLAASLGAAHLMQLRRKPSQSRSALQSDQSPAQKLPDAAGNEGPASQTAGNSVPAQGPAQGRAAIQFTSSPSGAMIRFDGQSSPSWLTPLNLDDVAPGPHEVIFTKNGYFTETRRIEISEKSSLYHVDLIRETTAVSVSTDPPGASIEIDGIDTGKIAPAQIPVTAGRHTVVVRLAGYQPDEASIQVGKGEVYNLPERLASVVSRNSGRTDGAGAPLSSTLEAGMADGKGLIDFVTVPPGASIFIEGRRANLATPAHSQFPPGDYSVELRMEGYKPVQQIVHVDAGQVRRVRAVLDPQ